MARTSSKTSASAVSSSGALAEVFGDAEARPYDVLLQDRDETYWLYVARVSRSA